jgi:hypothetical protein
MANLVEIARPIWAARGAIGESGDDAADAIASDPDVDASPSARLGGLLLGGDEPSDVSDTAGTIVDDATDAVPDWLEWAVPLALATIVFSVVAYAVGQLFSFEVSL